MTAKALNYGKNVSQERHTNVSRPNIKNSTRSKMSYIGLPQVRGNNIKENVKTGSCINGKVKKRVLQIFRQEETALGIAVQLSLSRSSSQ